MMKIQKNVTSNPRIIRIKMIGICLRNPVLLDAVVVYFVIFKKKNKIRDLDEVKNLYQVVDRMNDFLNILGGSVGEGGGMVY